MLVTLDRDVGHMSKFIRVLQLPADKHKRSLPKQIGINLMAAMGTVQQLISSAAPSPAGLVRAQCHLFVAWSTICAWCTACDHCPRLHGLSEAAKLTLSLVSQEKQHQECILADKAALVKLGILESLLALAVGGGGLPSCPVRTQVNLSSCISVDFCTCLSSVMDQPVLA